MPQNAGPAAHQGLGVSPPSQQVEERDRGGLRVSPLRFQCSVSDHRHSLEVS